MKLCGFNITVIGFLFNLVTWPMMEWRGCEVGYNLPSFATTVWHLFCYIVVEEVGFYYGHRLAFTMTILLALFGPIRDVFGCRSRYAYPCVNLLFVCLCVRVGCYTIPDCTSIFIRFIMSGQHPLASHPCIHTPWSMCSLTCCPSGWGPC